CLEQDFVLLQAKQAPPQLALHITLQFKRWVWGEQCLRRHACSSGPGRAGAHADPPFAREELLHQAAFERLMVRLLRLQSTQLTVDSAQHVSDAPLLLR